jgi:hypothetical protein
MRYEVRALSFAEILDTAFRLLRTHWRLLIGLPAVVYVPFAVLQHWVGVQASPGAAANLPVVVIAGTVAAVLAFVAFPIVFAGLTWAIGEVYVGRSPSMATTLREALHRLVPVMGTSLLYLLLVAGGVALVMGITLMLMFVVPGQRSSISILGGVATLAAGMWLFLTYLIVWPVMLLEGRYGMRALGRSRTLMQGRKWRGLGLTLVATLIASVLGGILQFALSMIPYLGPIVASLAQATGIAYQVAVTNLLYFDARSRLEAFDVEHLASQVAARGTVSG